MNLTNPLDGAVPSSALLAQLDRSILLLSGLAAKPQFHSIALRQVGLDAGRQPDHPAHLVDPALYAVLAELAHDRHQGATSVAMHLGLHPATVSRHLRTLGERDLVKVGPGLIDRRKLVVTMTPAGQAAYTILSQARAALIGSLLEYWEPRDWRELEALLRSFTARAVSLHRDENERRNEARTDTRAQTAAAHRAPGAASRAASSRSRE